MKRLEWTRELVDDFWSAVSATRLAELNFSRQAGPKLLDLIERHLRKDWRCLDFGAGDGDFVRLLLERGYAAAAWEPAQGRRENILRQDFCSHPRFLGVVGSETIAKFDCIFILDTIEHILEAELSSVFDTIKELLRPDGFLIVTTPNNEDLELNSVYCPKSGYFFHRWQHVRSFTADTLAEMLAGLGFERLHDHRVDFSHNAENLQEIKELRQEVSLRRRLGWFYPVGAYLRKLRNNTDPDLRIGAETHLIYLGRMRRMP